MQPLEGMLETVFEAANTLSIINPSKTTSRHLKFKLLQRKLGYHNGKKTPKLLNIQVSDPSRAVATSLSRRSLFSVILTKPPP